MPNSASFNPVSQASPASNDRSDFRGLIVVVSSLWWLTLALLSRMELSLLQTEWNSESRFVIFFFFSFCILLGWFGKFGFNAAETSPESAGRPVYWLFYLLMAVFAVQVAVYSPPMLSDDPNTARLDWGLKYVHVLTEIVMRAALLTCFGDAIARGKITASDKAKIVIALAYTVLVVSRSFMLEILIYWAIAAGWIKIRKREGFKSFIYVGLGMAAVVSLFIFGGQWRQGSDFNVSEYGGMLIDSNALAWIFGYFFVNFDNLALLIQEHFKNEAASNVFGSILQTFQISKYEEVDEYLYVGKFNLGTALRPYVLDFGPWLGGLIFAVCWIMMVHSPNFCRFKESRYSLILLIAYVGFCIPITGRIEQPPYLFALLLIVFFDRLRSFKFTL